MSSVLSNDGKPVTEFDLYKTQNVELNVKVDHKFGSKNPQPSLDYLKDYIVTEVVVTSVKTLVNTVILPFITGYEPKKGESEENLANSFTELLKSNKHENVVNRKLKWKITF